VTWDIEYRICSRCGQTTIITHHWMTNSNIEIDPLPDPEGTVLVDWLMGRSRVIPLKQMKNYPELWQVHAATCPGLQKEVRHG
jgi:hypothetical protein